MIRKALADELLFGRLVNGGRVTVDLNEKDDVVLEFPEGDVPPPPEPVETVEIE
jgi:ATP-dependent Clp protease ATP-binding subunit ClpA